MTKEIRLNAFDTGVPEGRAQGDPVNIVLIDRGPVVPSNVL
jgi:hypothetical protein